MIKSDEINSMRKIRSRNLRLLRIASGLSQMQLAELSGLSQKTISKVERGVIAWSIDTENIFTRCIEKFKLDSQ